jgi:hypothetical protein
MSEGTIVGFGESCFVSYRVTKIESQRRAKSRDRPRGSDVNT